MALFAAGAVGRSLYVVENEIIPPASSAPEAHLCGPNV